MFVCWNVCLKASATPLCIFEATIAAFIELQFILRFLAAPLTSLEGVFIVHAYIRMYS